MAVYRRALGICLIVVCVLSITACGSRRQPVSPPEEPKNLGTVEDLRLPQDLTVYATQVGAKRLLLDPESQARQNERYDRLFFGPWELEKASVRAADAFAIFGLKPESRPRGWAENLLPWSAENWAKLVTNANRDSYPSRLDKGITTAPTPLREAPTYSPRFSSPKKAGQGFPFDLFMYAMLPTGMPLLVTHVSADRSWLYVENALAAGWVPAQNVAITDEAFRAHYRTGRYAAILRDDVSLLDADGRFVTTTHIGTVLPVDSMSSSGPVLLAPARDERGRAVIVPVRVSAADAAIKPLPLTAGTLAGIGNHLMGEPYGWGGLYGNRDCSQLLRDVFTPFGVWLPRNSKAQAQAWEYVDFGKRDTAKKEQFILDEGKPFATLLWLPGHIALYIGKYEDRAVMFHDMWGIRTEENGKEGRHVIGRVVVTSTRPGVELPFVQDRRGLLNRMRGMSILR